MSRSTSPAGDVREAKSIAQELRRALFSAPIGVGATGRKGQIIWTARGLVNDIIDALSAPPADDVREELANELYSAASHNDGSGGHDLSHSTASYCADAVLAAFEVRLRGTVTPPAEHDRDHMSICRKCGHGLTAREILDGETPCPGGTVTDAEDWTDEQLDAAYKAFRAHERGSEFNEFREHVCSECGYAYSWPEGEDRRQRVVSRRSSRHIARAALEAAREARS